MPENPRETYRRMAALAGDAAALAGDAAASDEERASARAIMARYVARYGEEVAIPEEEEQADVRVETPHEFARRLAWHCGTFVGVKVVSYANARGAFAKNPRWVHFVGPRSAVEGAVALYAEHLPRMGRLLAVAENGYRFGAMRLPDAVPAAADESGPLDHDLGRALHAANAFGRSATRALPRGGGAP